MTTSTTKREIIAKNDSLGSLTQAIRFLNSERQRGLNKQSLINKFNNLPLAEKQNLFNKYRGDKRHNVCFITEYDICKIMNLF